MLKYRQPECDKPEKFVTNEDQTRARWHKPTNALNITPGQHGNFY